MNRRVFCGTILLAFSTLITGCASGQEWAAWKQPPITANSEQIQQN
jgi:hypothetical protein